MELSEKLLYFISVTLQVISQTYCQQFADKPRNTAVFKSQLVTIVCRPPSADRPDITVWNEFITTTTGTQISANAIIQHPKGEAKYGIVNQYDLQVKNTEQSDAGKYQCKVTLANLQAFAYVVVVDTMPSCTTDKANNIAAEGDTVTMTCQVDYHGGWGPNLQWTGPSGTQLPTTDASTGTTSKSTATVTANESLDGASYACGLTFPKPPQNLILTPDYDTRNPVFTSECSVPLTVHYGPRNVQTTGAKQQYEPGDKIRCTARGKPTVAYRWEKISGDGNGFPVSGAELTISAQMEGDSTIQCVASNTVGGQLKDARSAPLNITVYVPTTTSTAQPTTPIRTEATTSDNAGPGGKTEQNLGGNQPSSAGIVAGAVIGSIAGLILIIIVIYFLVIRKKAKKDDQEKPSRIDQYDGVGPPGARPKPAKKPDVIGASPTPLAFVNSKEHPPQGHPPPAYDDPRNKNVENIVYADLALDDTPRSRKPIQVYDPTDYAEIRRG